MRREERFLRSDPGALRQRPASAGTEKPGKARILGQSLEILVVTGLDPVLRAKSDGFRKVIEGVLRIAPKAVNGSQSIMNIFLAGNHLIRLTEILEGLVEVTAVECRNAAGIAAFRRFGTRFLVPLAFAKP